MKPKHADQQKQFAPSRNPLPDNESQIAPLAPQPRSTHLSCENSLLHPQHAPSTLDSGIEQPKRLAPLAPPTGCVCAEQTDTHTHPGGGAEQRQPLDHAALAQEITRRLAESVTTATRRKQSRAAQRQELTTRRRYGLRRRHEEKLERIAQAEHGGNDACATPPGRTHGSPVHLADPMDPGPTVGDTH